MKKTTTLTTTANLATAVATASIAAAATLCAAPANPQSAIQNPQSKIQNPQSPNIIFILCDDLGYGDIGVFFQNARAAAGKPAHATPNLDRLAAEGAKLTDHYCAAPVSAPSRASFISGLTQGHATVRDNQFDWAVGDNHTVATVLRQAGYATAAFGKWGLQGKGATAPNWPAHPLNRGFDYYYGYISHGDGHEHYPKEALYTGGGGANKNKNNKNNKNKKQQTSSDDSDGEATVGTKHVWDNRANVVDGLDKCYTTDLFAARAKKWIIDQNKKNPAQPFFIYLAYDTPHAVLELPPCPYPAGGGLKGGLQWLGAPGHMINTATGKPDSYMYPDYASKNWPEVNKRYASSVRRIDDTVGDIMQLLKDLAIDDNTLVIFTSDNGPSKESYLEKYIPNGAISPQFFASFGPFDGIKRDMWEGGTRVPAIARWPGHIPPATTVAAPCAMFDWLPTFAEAAHIAAPAETDGRSLLGNLTGHPTPASRGSGQPGDYLYFEYYNNARTPNYSEFEQYRRNHARNQMQAIRQGDYLAVRVDIKNANDDFEIYNVTRDQKEVRNLAKKPEGAALQSRFKALALQSRRPQPGTDRARPYDNVLIPAVTAPADAKPAGGTTSVSSASALTPGLAWSYYEGDFPWTPATAALTPQKTGATTDGPTLAGIPLRRGQNAAIVYQGYLNAPADGDYTFEAATDTGLVMRLHEATIIDADYGYKSGAKRTAKIRLQAGLHPITLTYHTNGKATPALTLKWLVPGATAPQPIAPEAFVH